MPGKKKHSAALVTWLGIVILTMLFLSLAAAEEKTADSGISESIDRQIGMRVFYNECGGREENLVMWNPGESFLSIGIGHFIWYPKTAHRPYIESFRGFIEFVKRQGRLVPDVFLSSCPWDNQAEFAASKGDADRSLLESFAKETVALQTRYLFHRLRRAVVRIRADLPDVRKSDIQEKYDLLMKTAEGRYALVDYVNFKGEGLSPGERIKGVGWGLKQVLMEMEAPACGNAAVLFARAAERVLERRARLDAENPYMQQWLLGWRSRVRSYADSFSTQP